MADNLSAEEHIEKMKLILGDEGFKEWVDFMLKTIEEIYKVKTD